LVKKSSFQLAAFLTNPKPTVSLTYAKLGLWRRFLEESNIFNNKTWRVLNMRNNKQQYGEKRELIIA